MLLIIQTPHVLLPLSQAAGMQQPQHSHNHI
jgi:hypothetical protein